MRRFRSNRTPGASSGCTKNSEATSRSKSSVRVRPNLPSEIDETLSFRPIIHCALPGGGYRQIPFSLDIRRRGDGKKRKRTLIKVNGKRAEKAEVWDLAGCRRVRIEIVGVYGR